MLKIRVARPEERAFIVDSWSRSYRTSRSAGVVPMDDWAVVMRRAANRILDMPDVVTRVAYDASGNPERSCLAWIAVGHWPTRTAVTRERALLARATGIRPRDVNGDLAELATQKFGPLLPVLHYCFTKHAFRNQGLASALARAAGLCPGRPLFFSCLTATGASIARGWPLAKYNNNIVRFAVADQPKQTPDEETEKNAPSTAQA